jgi:hypothetical protein
MPWLSEITYSREETITAVRDYYIFLTKLYLNETEVIEPPEDGWPSINSENLHDLGKSSEVIALLRHLPYIRRRHDGREAQGAPGCYFADWQSSCNAVIQGGTTCEGLKILSEDPEYLDDTPPHVIGLTSGGRNNPTILLDTRLGIVHWFECPDYCRHRPTREQIIDDPYDYAAENEREAEWRADAPAWAIPDFFELLKDQFRELNFVPVSSRSVEDVETIRYPPVDGMISMLQRIYREHGWPDLQQYRKQDCLDAVRRALQERYPQFPLDDDVSDRDDE